MKTTGYVLGLALSLIALAASTVRADSVTYNFSGTLADGNTVTGQFSLNDATQQVGAFSFTSPFSAAGVTAANYTAVAHGFVGGGPNSYPGEDFTLIEFSGPNDSNFLILWFPEAITSFDGGAIWTTALPGGLFFFSFPPPEATLPSYLQCFGNPGPPELCNPLGSFSEFTSGAAVPVPAPESSSFGLLACGLLGLVGAKRLLNNSARISM